MQQYTEHLAAVKAIAWSPHQHGLLASGGGTADRCIRFWNTLTGQPLQCIDTGSQVCNLAWSKHANELVSTTQSSGVREPWAQGPPLQSWGQARPLPPGHTSSVWKCPSVPTDHQERLAELWVQCGSLPPSVILQRWGWAVAGRAQDVGESTACL